MKKKIYNVKVELGDKVEDKSYEIHIENGCVHNDFLKTLVKDRDHAIITDSGVFQSFPHFFEGLNFIAIPSGESSKSLSIYEDLLNQMCQLGLTRHATIIAFGGGVVGDLAGFAAATYMRGVKYIQIPTTLLAMVDSSVGGKVALNLSYGKNLVGAFYQPSAVYIDPNLLKHLPIRQWSNGLAEVIKYGLAFDKRLFDGIENAVDEILTIMASKYLQTHDEEMEIDRTSIFEKYKNLSAVMPEILPMVAEIIARCCEIKAKIVAEDERDFGVRNLLNFGHTIGHAIEQYYEYDRYMHGEAVAIGMAVQARMSLHSGDISDHNYRRVIDLITRCGLPVKADTGIDEHKLFEFTKHDKKASESMFNYVALDDIGEAVIVHESPETAFSKFIGGLNAQSGKM